MNQEKFISQLRAKLSGLPQKDVEDRLSFYAEMIDDRMEDGLSEEDAICEIGSVEEIYAQILSEIPLSKIVKEQVRPKRKFKAWEIVLLALGSPIWLSLLIAAFAVIFSLYAVIWSVIVSLWAIFAALAACGGVGTVFGLSYVFTGYTVAGSFLISAALLSAGLSIFMFFGCLAATKGTIQLTKNIVLMIKNSFARKENRYV